MTTRHHIDVELTIAGIPCGAHITRYQPARPMRITGPGYGDCDPPEFEDVEFIVVDRKGYPADWLVNKEPYEAIESKVMEALTCKQ